MAERALFQRPFRLTDKSTGFHHRFSLLSLQGICLAAIEAGRKHFKWISYHNCAENGLPHLFSILFAERADLFIGTGIAPILIADRPGREAMLFFKSPYSAVAPCFSCFFIGHSTIPRFHYVFENLRPSNAPFNSPAASIMFSGFSPCDIL